MSDTYHINIGAYNTDTHAVGTHTIRIWAHLLACSQWMFSKPIPGHFLVQHGISMTLINNMAIVVEGLIGDICWEHAQNKPQASLVSGIDHMTWKKKRVVYNKLFTKKLEDYWGFDGNYRTYPIPEQPCARKNLHRAFEKRTKRYRHIAH